LHFGKELHPLFNKKERNCESMVDIPLRFDKFWSDERLIFPINLNLLSSTEIHPSMEAMRV